MSRNTSIKASLITGITMLVLIAATIGTAGIVGLRQVSSSLRTMYEGRLAPLEQMDRMIRLLERQQLTVEQALTDDAARRDAALDAVQRDDRLADVVWSRYRMNTLRSAGEEQLAVKFSAMREQFRAQGLQPALAALRSDDLPLAGTLVRGALRQRYAAVTDSFNAMQALHRDLGQREYARSQRRYDNILFGTLCALAVLTLAAVHVGVRLVRRIAAPLRHAADVARDIAGGDLSQQIVVGADDEPGQVLHALKLVSGSMTMTVQGVNAGIRAIASASRQIAGRLKEASLRTEAQASCLGHTASTMTQLAAAIKEGAEHARQADQLVVTASDCAEQGREVVTRMMETMASIRESSAQITDIISVIDDIAYQTNLLALNASMDAAYAGFHGTSFAVVATEVRQLAHRSAASAKAIRTLINHAMEKVEAGVLLTDDVGAHMREIAATVRESAQVVGHIASASGAQSIGIEQVHCLMTEMDGINQRNTALIAQAYAAATGMQVDSDGLDQTMAAFQLDSAAPRPQRGVPLLRVVTPNGVPAARQRLTIV